MRGTEIYANSENTTTVQLQDSTKSSEIVTKVFLSVL